MKSSILFFSILIIGCSHNTDSNFKPQHKIQPNQNVSIIKIDTIKVVSPSDQFFADYENDSLITNLKKKLFDSDYESYCRLREIYYYTGNKNEFIYYAISFGSKFKNGEACYDVFSLLEHHKNEDVRFMANIYLLKAEEYGSERSNLFIQKRFSDKNITLNEYLKNQVK